MLVILTKDNPHHKTLLISYTGISSFTPQGNKMSMKSQLYLYITVNLVGPCDIMNLGIISKFETFPNFLKKKKDFKLFNGFQLIQKIAPRP